MNISLKTKIVSTDNLYFLQFLYPNYIISNNIPLYKVKNSGIIYNGNVDDLIIFNLKRLYNDKYIIISDKNPDVKLHRNSDYIELFFKYSKSQLYNCMQIDEFFDLLKKHIVTGKRMPKLSMSDEENIFLLYKNMTESYSAFMKQFFALTEIEPFEVVSSKILTFLIKVMTRSLDSESPIYRRILDRANVKFGKKIKPAVMSYLSRNENSKFSFLIMIDQIIK